MGTVGREIGLGLWKRGVDVHYLGWFSGSIQNDMPFPVYPTQGNYYGSDKLNETILKIRPDILLTIGDQWMVSYISDKNRLSKSVRQLFTWVGYIPIDGHTFGEKLPYGWENTVNAMDYAVAYTKYGKRVIENSCPDLDIPIIYHGVNTKECFPLKEEHRVIFRKNLGIEEDTIVYLVVARNQFRKNLPEILKAWKIFKSKGNFNAKIWLHCSFNDPMGWKLDQIICNYKLEDDVLFFEDVAHSDGMRLLDRNKLNALYNIGDVFVLQSGEGFGLPTVEAMACRKPVILLDHSANTELAEGRGETVKPICTMAGKYSTERPYPDINLLADKMAKFYKDKKLREKYGNAGYEFAKTITWDIISEQWYQYLDKVVNPLKHPIKMREVA